MVKGFACRTEYQKAVGVCPLSVRPLRSVIVPEIEMGSSKPRSAKILCAAKMPALVLSVSVMVSNSSRSAPPSIRPLIASA
jgi:hypothetical protein